MNSYIKIFLTIIVLLFAANSVKAQRLIEYEAGMGSRDASLPDTWILYQKVKAMHEGMVLYADSALLNTVQNDFTAFRDIKIVLTDTTTIYGSHLLYNGNTRIVDIWGDTVTLIDGATILKTDRLSFDRNTSTAYYTNWGHTVNNYDTVDSRVGRYNTEIKEFYLYNEVVLKDSASQLMTDTLVYNTITSIANFASPTRIYSDSTTLYSESGFYNTKQHYAMSYKESRVRSGQKRLLCDTLHYYEDTQFGRAYGNVAIFDSLNDIACYGRYGESDQTRQFSFVTDSALVIFVDKGDSLFMHADTIYATHNEEQEIETIRANYGVRLFRVDVQGLCDSAFYAVKDSLLTLYHSPVIWYDSFQCAADTIELFMEHKGVKLAKLKSNSFAIGQCDPDKFNQIKGKNTNVYFLEGEPTYADVLGSAQMVYYVTEDDPKGLPDAKGNKPQLLVGVNVGMGANMRIYFSERQPTRVSTFGNPDMNTYPLSLLPPEKKQLPGFNWQSDKRPRDRHQVFMTKKR